MAYVSAESGSPDVRAAVSRARRNAPDFGRGRALPHLVAHGRVLFYLGSDKRIRVTTYTASGNSFSSVTPRVWSERQLGDWGVNRMYDLAPGGKRFAVAMDPEDAGVSKLVTSVTVVLNFFDELRRRVLAAGRTE